jgi:hypothetical protein
MTCSDFSEREREREREALRETSSFKLVVLPRCN